jgi:hypothetical protein
MPSPMVRSLAADLVALAMVVSSLPLLVANAASSAISIGTVSPTGATVGTPVTLSANVSSSAGSITSCNLYVDNDDKGPMAVAYGKATQPFTFMNSQVYTVFVFCRDSASNFNSGPNIAVWAQGGSGGNSDINPPIVGSISPASAEAGKVVTLSVNVYDDVAVASCQLYVDGNAAGSMQVESGVAMVSYVFPSSKTYVTHVQCKDGAGNIGTGSTVSVSVTPPSDVPSLTEGLLVKLACPAGATADHPCKAVYYVGKDGMRHAFPNANVYFTWYANFDAVQEISPEFMSSFVLGKNVTYRPGSRMVKFTTVPFVYAVAKGGVLRWIKTEEDAAALYGADWNKKIDDINDALFSSYSYGADVTPASPFNVELELNGALTIDATL